MSDDQFTKLFKYMTQHFDKLESQVEGKADKADVDRILGAIDAVAKQQEIDDHERLAMNHQLNRHERWHHQTADKLGLKLDYES